MRISRIPDSPIADTSLSAAGSIHVTFNKMGKFLSGWELSPHVFCSQSLSTFSSLSRGNMHICNLTNKQQREGNWSNAIYSQSYFICLKSSQNTGTRCTFTVLLENNFCVKSNLIYTHTNSLMHYCSATLLLPLWYEPVKLFSKCYYVTGNCIYCIGDHNKWSDILWC